ncbi:MAG: glycine--tRNA ligase subunit beta, partial [Actinomycetia bacterium]|nr:glycine--tRNA ligase subunit beta [Actinomycetes bacterium]
MGIDLLFELGMEEVPSEPLKSMLGQVEQNVKKYLSLYNIKYKKSRVLATPRRIVLFIENCSETQKDSALEVKGPPKKAAFDSEGKPTKAADGFSKSQKIKVTDLVIKEVEGGEYVFAIKKEKGKETFSLLPEILKKVVLDIKFSKAMRWDEGHTRFIRPIRWMLALWGNKIIPIKIDTIKSSDKTYGHRFLSEKTIKIKNASGYFNKIKENNVVVDQKERA